MKLLQNIISLYEKSESRLLKYLSEAGLLLLLLGYYSFGFFYKQFLASETKLFLFVIVLFYLLIVLPYNFFIKNNYTLFFRSQKIILIFLRFLNSFFQITLRKPTEQILKSKDEKFTLLFFLVKIIFIPAMTKYMVDYSLLLIEMIKDNLLNLEYLSQNYHWFFFVSMLVVIVDTAYFSFGYMVEHGKLNNRIRSVDTSVLGWISALACYIPFNAVTFNLIRFYPSENLFWINEKWTTILYLCVLFFYLTYLSTTISLGAKCSNLTNRGIVTKGLYKYVRHPAYTSKIVSWWAMCVPIMDIKVVLSMLAWTFIYVLRAYTEEKHLLLDADYKTYVKETKWQFIPYIV